MDRIRVSVVNFRVSNADVEDNRTRMEEYVRRAKDAGADIVIFPEMALTGYDYSPEPDGSMMPQKLAETIEGVSVKKMRRLADELKMYIVFGMPERDMTGEDKVYNSAVVAGPGGFVTSHRKTHIAPPESKWAAKGSRATVFDTPWGPVGLAICYEVYRYPEFIRYAAAKGAGLFINCTAASEIPEPASGMRTSLDASAVQNHIYIASSNICGRDVTSDFFGGSHIVGPAEDGRHIKYYAGVPFGGRDALKEDVYTAELNLKETENNQFMFRENPDYGTPDFWPGLFRDMYAELAETEKYRR